MTQYKFLWGLNTEVQPNYEFLINLYHIRPYAKKFIRKKFCKTAEDVVYALNEWHDSVTPEMCQKIINSLKTVIPIVIKNKGGWSNH